MCAYLHTHEWIPQITDLSLPSEISHMAHEWRIHCALGGQFGGGGVDENSVCVWLFVLLSKPNYWGSSIFQTSWGWHLQETMWHVSHDRKMREMCHGCSKSIFILFALFVFSSEPKRGECFFFPAEEIRSHWLCSRDVSSVCSLKKRKKILIIKLPLRE